jgi:hypothetical protein
MPTLNQDDLPTIEEWVRSSGDEYLEELVPEGDPVEYTSFGLINTLWGSRIGAIFISELGRFWPS